MSQPSSQERGGEQDVLITNGKTHVILQAASLHLHKHSCFNGAFHFPWKSEFGASRN